MEPTGFDSIKEKHYALRSATHKMSTFISPKKISLAEFNKPDSIVVTGRTTGCAQYVNEFLRQDAYSKKYWTSLIGAVGAKLAKIIDKKMGGAAPMWTDTSAGLGGQLPINVIKAKYDFDPATQKTLDEKGLNAIGYSSSYGVMILSQKTTQDPSNPSDWSYLGHSMAFDLIKREIKKHVMLPQIGKLNDEYYQSMRQQQTDSILNRRTQGANKIWTAGRVEVASQNTDEVKAMRKFVIKLIVKVTPFSEEVELILQNVDQLTQV
jgi:hypothetical protein